MEPTQGYLAARVDAAEGRRSERVPEPNAAVRGAAAAGQQAVLVRRPRDGLHRRRVLVETRHRHLFERERGVKNVQHIFCAVTTESKDVRV